MNLLPNAVAWCQRGLELPPLNWKRRVDAIRGGAGLLANWPHDAMRHSFASYHLAAHGSADKTATELGHRSTDMLFRHYRELVTPEDAARFWSLLP